MIDTEFEKNFLKYCRKYDIQIKCSPQTELHMGLDITQTLKESISDKQGLVWLKNNKKGQEYGVIRNQVYLASPKSTEVDIPLKLTFEETFQIWEAYEQGTPIDYIYGNFEFDLNHDPDDILTVIWTLEKGRWNYILDYLEDGTYPFDFMKYLGRY